MTITRGAFGLWHETVNGRHTRVFRGNLAAVKRTLRAEGVTEVTILEGGVQRPRYRTIAL